MGDESNKNKKDGVKRSKKNKDQTYERETFVREGRTGEGSEKEEGFAGLIPIDSDASRASRCKTDSTVSFSSKPLHCAFIFTKYRL